jgi:ribosomal protein L25 (general stress protein Ctc)
MSDKAIMVEGKYKLLTFQLTTPTQPIDLTPYCARADIYESILDPTPIGEFIISDKTGLFSHFNFVEQIVCIKFTTYEDNPKGYVSYDFRIIKAGPAESTQDDKGIVYKLTGISREAAKSPTLKNVPITREKIECENMVRAYLEPPNLLDSKKQLFVEKTKGLHTFVMNNITPLEAIDQVRMKAVSQKYEGSAFVFFENSRGYHFKTLEGLCEEGLKNIGDKHYIQTGLAKVDVTGSKWRNILAFKAIPNVNQTVARTIGGGKNKVFRLNIKTREYEEYSIDARKLDFVQLNKGSFTSSIKAQEEINKDDGAVKTIVYDPDKETNDYADKANKLPYYLSHFLTTVLQLTVYGDTTVSVGDVITCDIPEHDALPISENKPYVDSSSVVAGNYLITKCRHVLTFNEKAEYMQALEVVRDGYGGQKPRAKKFGEITVTSV